MKRLWIAVVLACLGGALFAGPASAITPTGPAPSYPGMQVLHYHAGPYVVTPGRQPHPAGQEPCAQAARGRLHGADDPEPALRHADGKCCGTVPRVDVIHLHHGVWLTNGAAGEGEGNSTGPFYPFMASGEEKTIYDFPHGYGYPVGANDYWVLNYMIHNLTSKQATVYIDYTSTSCRPPRRPRRASRRCTRSGWTSRHTTSIPVFDVHRHSGVNGKFTFPDMAKNPYPAGQPPLNEFTIDHPGTLVATAGHVHPGGLYDDLDLIRPGATPSGGAIPGPVPNSVRLFRSNAHYWDPRGPISWDMAMTGTAPDWRPQVKAGDTLRVQRDLRDQRASWYESMGIMVVWEAWNRRRDRSVQPRARPERPPHPRPPGREQQPRRRVDSRTTRRSSRTAGARR